MTASNTQGRATPGGPIQLLSFCYWHPRVEVPVSLHPGQAQVRPNGVRQDLTRQQFRPLLPAHQTPNPQIAQ